MKVVFAASLLVSIVAARQLSLTWKDCGDSSTKAKITDFTPAAITLGQTTTLTGTGDLSEGVTGATYDVTMTGAIGQLLHCTGDASASKTCHLPLHVGSLTFDAMHFPIAAGKVSVSVELSLSGFLPASLATTKTIAKATARSGAALFCLEIDSAPAMEAHPTQAAAMHSHSQESAVAAAVASAAAAVVADWGNGNTLPGEVEKMFCKVAQNQFIADTVTSKVCNTVEHKPFNIKIPNCQADAKELWDMVANMCPKASEDAIAANASPGAAEQMLCKMLHNHAMEFMVTSKVCTTIAHIYNITVKDCQLSAMALWDVVSNVCPKDLETTYCPPACRSCERECAGCCPSSADADGSSANVEGGQLGLTYKDCGDSATHAKITGLTPNTATIGRKTTITGTGQVDTDIADGTFDMQVAFSEGVPLADCQGDASVSKKCNFPFHSGSLTFDGVNFPIKAGPQNINVDLHLSPFLPAGLIKTTTEITAVSKNNEKIFCIKVITGNSDENGVVSLSYEDCGDSQTHAKITALHPTSVRLGRTTRLTGTGILDKDIMDGTFQTQTFYSGGDLLDCSGDASQSKTCSLLGGLLGHLRFNGLQFPVKKGSSSVSVDMSLSRLVPAALAKTKTRVTASTKSGEKIFCMEVFTAPASADSNSAAVIVV